MGSFNLLPSDIISEILSRVPTESVLECKLVSKLWRNLLQHSSFSHMHLNHLNDLDSSHHSGKLSFIFYTRMSTKEPFYYTEYDENLRRFSRTIRIDLRPLSADYILGSCNGLVCLSVYINNVTQPAFVCNPITREYIVLPKLEGKRFITGFGYSPSTNNYKVVRICASREDPNYGVVQVYTLGSGIGWRNARKMDYDVISFCWHGAFANGAIHWVDHKGTMVAFDLADEEFRELPSPPWLPPTTVDLHVLGGLLCASLWYHHVEGFHIWVLKKNESNHDVVWSKELSVMTGELITFTKSGGLLCRDFCDKIVYGYAPKASSRVVVNFYKKFDTSVPHKNTLVSLKELREDAKLLNSGERARSCGGAGSSGQ